MDDQVARLQSLGLRAERIHSGRPRPESRQVCLDYIAGELDFLFIAPERLGVERLSRAAGAAPARARSPSTRRIASRSGVTTFAPTTGLLGQRLPLAATRAGRRALTATATPLVQRDIVAQLGLGRERAPVHSRLSPRQLGARDAGGRAQRSARLTRFRGWRAPSACRRSSTRRRAKPPKRRPGCLATRFRAAAVPRRAGRRGARARADRFSGGSARRGGGHRGVRHGRRQGQHPHGAPPGAARQRRVVLPGDRSRRSRRQAVARRA